MASAKVTLFESNSNAVNRTQCFLLKQLSPVTEPKAAQMAEWNAFYQNEEEEEAQEEGEQSGGEMKTYSIHTVTSTSNNKGNSGALYHTDLVIFLSTKLIIHVIAVTIGCNQF